MESKPRNARKYWVPAFAIGAVALLVPVGLLGATANHQPADKLAASGATLEILRSELLDPTDEQTILSGTMRTSKPTDLILSLTMECALWTEVAVIANGTSEAIATVSAWIEIDGNPVLVASGDPDGRVVFCNRVYRMQVSNVDDEDQEIKQYLETRAANAFNWIALNVGSGVHTIEVKALLDASSSGSGGGMAGFVDAGIGKRTLVAEPVKMANDASV